MEVRLLGALEVWSGSTRIPVGGARAECVLAVLLLENNHAVMVDRLVEAAWGERPPMTATTQVRKIVAELRRRLPGGAGLIVTDGAGYRAVVAEGDTDLGVFDARVRRAREAAAAGDPESVIEHLQAALALWRGPVLAGIDSPVVRAAVTVLAERRLAAAEQLMEARLNTGASRELIPDLHALLAEHPMRETPRGQLMLALYRSGRQAEALQVYEDGRRLLGEELGLDPGPELARLRERILRNQPELDGPAPAVVAAPPVARPPRALPYDMADFVGRVDEQNRIRACVEVCVGLAIVALDGMAGVGKTSLVVHVAHQVADRFPDGQFYVDLQGYAVDRKPMHPVEALGVLLREAGVPEDELPEGLAARAELWRMRTAGSRILVLLDNVADTAQVLALLPGTPDGLVMITSRSRLTGVDGALSVSLEPPPVDDGLRLLVGILGTDRVEREPEAARELVEACDRLPLAIRIASTRLHNREKWSIGYLVDRLRVQERKLGELSVGDRSVAAAIGLSYDALEPDQQRVFRLLGLLPDPEFDVRAAAALAALPLGETEPVLEELLDMRLLVQHAPGRYGLHELVFSFARSLVDRVESRRLRTTAAHRLLDHYLAAATTAASVLVPGRTRTRPRYRYPPERLPELRKRAAAIGWFDAECRGLLAAVRSARDHGLHEHAFHLSDALRPYLRIRGRMRDMLDAQEIAVVSARTLGDRTLEGWALLRLAAPHWHFGRLREALDCVETALAVADETGDETLLRTCRGGIGRLLNEFGRYEEALPHHRLAVEEGAARERPREVAVLVNMATAQAAMSDFTTARSTLDEALRLARRPNEEALALARYADVCRRTGRLDEARDLGLRASSLLRHFDNQATAASVINLLGHVHLARGELDVALERHVRAREIAEDVDFRLEIAHALDGAARVLVELSDTRGAAEHWRLALTHYEEMGTPEAGAVRGRLASLPLCVR